MLPDVTAVGQCRDPNPGLGPYTLETAIGGRYAEYYGGWVWKRCAIAMWFNVRVYWSIPFGFKFNWPPMPPRVAASSPRALACRLHVRPGPHNSADH